MGEILEFIRMASEGKPYQPNGLVKKPDDIISLIEKEQPK